MREQQCIATTYSSMHICVFRSCNMWAGFGYVINDWGVILQTGIPNPLNQNHSSFQVHLLNFSLRQMFTQIKEYMLWTFAVRTSFFTWKHGISKLWSHLLTSTMRKWCCYINSQAQIILNWNELLILLRWNILPSMHRKSIKFNSYYIWHSVYTLQSIMLLSRSHSILKMKWSGQLSFRCTVHITAMRDYQSLCAMNAYILAFQHQSFRFKNTILSANLKLNFPEMLWQSSKMFVLQNHHLS